jgi:hypothetical protein
MLDSARLVPRPYLHLWTQLERATGKRGGWASAGAGPERRRRMGWSRRPRHTLALQRSFHRQPSTPSSGRRRCLTRAGPPLQLRTLPSRVISALQQSSCAAGGGAQAMLSFPGAEAALASQEPPSPASQCDAPRARARRASRLALVGHTHTYTIDTVLRHVTRHQQATPDRAARGAQDQE